MRSRQLGEYRLLEALSNLFPRLAQPTAGPNVVLQVVQSAVQLRALRLRQRHRGGVSTESIPDLAQQLELRSDPLLVGRSSTRLDAADAASATLLAMPAVLLGFARFGEQSQPVEYLPHLC